MLSVLIGLIPNNNDFFVHFSNNNVISLLLPNYTVLNTNWRGLSANVQVMQNRWL